MDGRGMIQGALKILAAVCLAGSLAGSSALVQEGMGNARLTGEVKDEAGNPLPGVRVALLHIESETLREVVTDRKGKWGILGLGSGVWKVILTLEGYRPRIEETYVGQIGRSAVVKSVLRKAQPKGPDAEEDLGLVEKGNRLFEDKNCNEALSLYRQFLDKHPNHFQVHFNIGNCYKEMGEYEKALEEYGLVLDKVRETNPDMNGDALATKTLAATGEIALKKGRPGDGPCRIREGARPLSEIREPALRHRRDLFFQRDVRRSRLLLHVDDPDKAELARSLAQARVLASPHGGYRKC